ncbi:MAG: hypothetical protein LBJ00_02445, partial [Planctomycetaceae bacterium]|nr:hypothetical protein [Planctomycetaceae bacterium]
MESKIQTETELTTQINSQNSPKQSRFKKWMLNLIAVMFGFIVICGVLGVLDILAQRELKKTGEALPKLFLYRWKSKDKFWVQYDTISKFEAYDPLNGPIRDLEKVFPNLVDNYLPYIIANYFKIFVRQSCLPNFESHSQMSPRIVTPDLLDKLERP